MYAETGDSAEAWTAGRGGRGDNGASGRPPMAPKLGSEATPGWGGGTAPSSKGGGRLLICARGGGRILWRRELAALGW